MPERDGYIPGVPCWVDASEPDPEAALDFYGGLFGWEFQDSPAGWPQRWETKNPEIFRTNGRPTAQWSRLKAGRSDDLGTAGR
jgi:hypothetical protein